MTTRKAKAERFLLPAIHAAKPRTPVVADGFSYREQVAQDLETRSLHLLRFLLAVYRDNLRSGIGCEVHKSAALAQSQILADVVRRPYL